MATNTQRKPLVAADFDRKAPLGSEYDPGKTVNDERFGDILYAHNKKNQKMIFVKEKVTNSEQEATKEIYQAQDRLALNHPNVQTYLDYSTKTKSDFCSKYYTVRGFYELPDSDLKKQIAERKKNGDGFSSEELTHVAYQILNGLKHLHSKNIIFGDLRPEFISFSKSGNEHKLLDRLRDPSDALTANKNNLANSKALYCSPAIYEALKKKTALNHNGPKSDSWSLGLCLLEAATLDNVRDIYNQDGTINQQRLSEHLGTVNQRYGQQNPLVCELIQYLLNIPEAQRYAPTEALSLIPAYDQVVDHFNQTRGRPAPQNDAYIQGGAPQQFGGPGPAQPQWNNQQAQFAAQGQQPQWNNQQSNQWNNQAAQPVPARPQQQVNTIQNVQWDEPIQRQPAPQQIYAQPQQVYTQVPQQTQVVAAAPTYTYAAPATNYVTPVTTYAAAPVTTYAAPVTTYATQPATTFVRPASTLVQTVPATTYVPSQTLVANTTSVPTIRVSNSAATYTTGVPTSTVYTTAPSTVITRPTVTANQAVTYTTSAPQGVTYTTSAPQAVTYTTAPQGVTYTTGHTQGVTYTTAPQGVTYTTGPAQGVTYTTSPGSYTVGAPVTTTSGTTTVYTNGTGPSNRALEAYQSGLPTGTTVIGNNSYTISQPTTTSSTTTALPTTYTSTDYTTGQTTKY